MSKPVRPGVEALDLEKMGNYFSGQNLTFLKKKQKQISNQSSVLCDIVALR